MPEIPDLVYIEQVLREKVEGAVITASTVGNPIVLRQHLQGDFRELVSGRGIEKIHRTGPFLTFSFKDRLLVFHFMLAGKLKLVPVEEKPSKKVFFSLYLDNGLALQYLDDKQMGKVYLLALSQVSEIPGYTDQGIDILSDEFTFEVFKRLIARVRKQVRSFIMDQEKLSAIGNAYADEILFDAGIHPKTPCNRLNPEEVEHLFESIKRTMKWGVAEVRQAGQPIEKKIRGHVKVRNRKGEPCPVCGATIRRANVLGYDAFFCPHCQKAGTSQFIDWEG
jgi:formamidopyrimidine-DNA glycosylase